MDIRTIVVQKVMEALRGRTDEETVGVMQDMISGNAPDFFVYKDFDE